ncbi:aTP synthase subunit F [Clostridium sp. CAG:1013]|jgi:V/A-type H+-transporting ATPase subunit F|nr:aTP synthase subunit F [Clostridium sp. CAG:1013]
MYKIAVLGDRDSIYGFGALGLEVFPIEEAETGAKTLRRLAEEDYAVLYVTEALCAQIPQELERLRERPLPAVVPIPGLSGNTGMGMAMVKRSVEQAVGSDILANES